MADLLKAASEIFNKGFDVENDPVSDFEPINDGVYSGYIEGFEHKEFSTGTEALQFKVKISDEPYEGRSYFGALFLSEKVINTSIKRLLKYAHRLGIELGPEDFSDTDLLVEKMQEAVGYQCTLTLKTTVNKKGEFQSFELEF